MTTVKQKKTPEEKAFAKALKVQEAADQKMKWEFEHAAELAAYKAGLPKRLMDAQARAGKLGVRSEVTLTETGPEVSFYNDKRGHYVETTLSYNSDEWEVEALEQDLQQLQDKHDLAEKRRECAQSAWNNLTEDQKSCLREYINWMR
jgi:hypothetical protein